MDRIAIVLEVRVALSCRAEIERDAIHLSAPTILGAALRFLDAIDNISPLQDVLRGIDLERPSLSLVFADVVVDARCLRGGRRREELEASDAGAGGDSGGLSFLNGDRAMVTFGDDVG
ncbi:hypothetical protein [Tardiphaga sp. P9-11]|uniref:hypothetical protein n=1 Tax=Tardiphaga sp. P9-11 TaxID=2024614 RepID=UPI0011F39E06|nr:hypothetical protein [Tardiphaga sp. P9-11]KAA0070447.1 hypothetical protein CIW50_26715 [Tardiphaga sp. P9-11]